MASPCTISISSSPRSLTNGDSAVFTPSEAVLTWSWGLQPATALVEWVSATALPAIVPGCSVVIEIAGHVFYGMTDNLVERVASDGISLLQEFRDNREYLNWDVVNAAFNLHDARVVSGKYVRRYKHLLPVNFKTLTWTFTNTPYTAAQILNFLFASDTVGTNWQPVYHPLMNNPVFSLDYAQGQKLGQCLVDISEQLGLVFTLVGGPYTLYWELKGVGTLPGFPVNSDNRRSGSALSGNPSQIKVLGDRNRYQILNCPMQPDWLPAWQTFWDFGAFVNDIFLNESTNAPVNAGTSGVVPLGTPYRAIPNDLDHVVGYALAGARARLLTVSQYADLVDARYDSGLETTLTGDSYRDSRRYQGRSRLQLPVALYLSQILFRAFKLADNFTFRAANGSLIGEFGYDLDSKPIVEITHDPVTGQMNPLKDGNGNYVVPDSSHNGYAIVQGYQVGQDAFGTLNPDYFDYTSWISAQTLWQVCPFQIDDSGEGTQFIVFDQPVINSGDLIKAAANALPSGRARGYLSATPTITIPPVMACLTVLGENFSLLRGTGPRTDVANVAELHGEYLIYAPGRVPVEQPYLDGSTATQKGQVYGDLLLNQQFYYQNGGYVVQGVDGVSLSSVVDRITLRWNAREGLTKEVDWANERSRNVTVNAFGTAVLQLPPEREFDRRSQLDPLFPGQDALRVEARQLRLEASVLRANPSMLQALVNTFHLLMGLDTPPQTVLTDSAASGSAQTLAVGTPLFQDPNNTVAWTPNDASTTPRTSAVFVGVTTLDGESVNAGVRVTAGGAGGIVQARVMGPVSVGDVVGLGQYAQTYFTSGPAVVVGQVVEAIASAAVGLIRVKLGTAQVSGKFKGEYSSLVDAAGGYSLDCEVIISTGDNLGTYVYVNPSASSGLAAPWVGGGYWVQKPGGLYSQWQ